MKTVISNQKFFIPAASAEIDIEEELITPQRYNKYINYVL